MRFGDQAARLLKSLSAVNWEEFLLWLWGFGFVAVSPGVEASRTASPTASSPLFDRWCSQMGVVLQMEPFQ